MKTTKFFQDALAIDWSNKTRFLGPDELEKYFSGHYSSFQLFELAGCQVKRFIPGVFGDADACCGCGKRFDWQDPREIAYLSQFTGYEGKPMPTDEQELFLLDVECLTEMAVCESCKQKLLKQYFAILACARAAKRREMAERKQKQQNARRMETFIREVAEGVYLFAGEDDDGGALLEYVLSNFVDYSALADFPDDVIKQSFSDPDIYFYLFDERTAARDREFWQRTVVQFQRDSAAGQGDTLRIIRPSK